MVFIWVLKTKNIHKQKDRIHGRQIIILINSKTRLRLWKFNIVEGKKKTREGWTGFNIQK